ncbi:extracellular solute-binding protein [Paenibacillus sp. IB182496]|uniref:Extracellular solute-binding protein n=1 Tax=Paenibacillus sabuli TaxID=2772509 RepID=A0A927BS30_9BACL|nr:extracellular solute-binding protein [Paenibacillus sabuli]MBD2844881.1 extracellular solute-binding protein [Paenibacillus sabuli]
MSSKRFKKLLFPVLALLITLSLLAGCAGQNEEEPPAPSEPAASEGAANGATADTPAEPAAEEPFPISMMILTNNPETPEKDNAIQKAIEAHTNTKLNITWVPSDTYDEKTNLMMASGEMPMLMYVKSMKSSSILNAVKAGAFWEIGPHLANYPNLSQASEGILYNASIDGKVYAVYKHSAPAQVGVTYRKDWLDQLGLTEPTTPDEYYDMMKAFKEQDPDQDGQDNTYGMIYWKEDFLAMFRIAANWFGSPNIWGEDENGNLEPDFVTEAYMAALNFMKKLYDEQLMNQDFAVVAGSKANEMYLAGEGGSMFSSLNNPPAWEAAGKTEEGAVLDVFSTLDAGHGARARAGTGYLGVYMIPKKSVPEEADFKRVMKFLDQLNDKEVQDLLEYGVEGTHYNIEDGKAIIGDREMLQKDLLDYKQLQLKVVSNLTPEGGLPPLREKVEALKLSNEEVAVYNLAQPFDSDTYTRQGQQLDNMRYDMMVKYIMGHIDAAGYQAEVEKWMNAGGSKVIEELNAQYQQAKS